MTAEWPLKVLFMKAPTSGVGWVRLDWWAGQRPICYSRFLDCTAAGPIAIAASQNEDVEEPWFTYLHLWQAILLSATPDKPVVGSKPSTAPRLGLYKEADVPEQLALQQQAVYDALMRAVMDAVRNLDLEYHQAQAGVDVDAGAKVTSPDSMLHSEQVCVLHMILGCVLWF